MLTDEKESGSFLNMAAFMHLQLESPLVPSEGLTPSSVFRSGSKSHFRVYSNAFQEPLPAPRWGASKTAVCSLDPSF